MHISIFLKYVVDYPAILLLTMLNQRKKLHSACSVRDPKGVAQQVLRMKGMDFKTTFSF